MGTIYNWSEEVSADTTSSGGDYVLLFDTSAGVTKKAYVHQMALGGPTLGLYGVTAVDQPTFTATALTALATATISAANTSAVYGFASSTVAASYAKRASQIQADLETLMARVESTGLLAISGVP